MGLVVDPKGRTSSALVDASAYPLTMGTDQASMQGGQDKQGSGSVEEKDNAVDVAIACGSVQQEMGDYALA